MAPTSYDLGKFSRILRENHASGASLITTPWFVNYNSLVGLDSAFPDNPLRFLLFNPSQSHPRDSKVGRFFSPSPTGPDLGHRQNHYTLWSVLTQTTIFIRKDKSLLHFQNRGFFESQART